MSHRKSLAKASPLLVLAFAGASAAAQVPSPAANGSPVARALRDWAADYRQGRLGAKAVVRSGRDLQPRYLEAMRQAGLVYESEEGRVTHLDMLGKLLYFAEKNPNEELAEAVLDVAAIGFDHALVDLETLEIRELGLLTLLRMEDQGAWFVVMRTAAGERAPDAFVAAAPGPGQAVVPLGPGAARRVAALQALAKKNLPVARGVLLAALRDDEPRVRLAAAESLLPPWSLETVATLVEVLADESHPVASQAQVRLLLDVLKNPPEELTDEAREDLLGRALQRLGQCGWRTDMELLDLVEASPCWAAIEPLIAHLERVVQRPDALVDAVNKRASPMLRQRLGSLLQRLTGALVPAEEPQKWRAFWAAEGDAIVVPKTLQKPAEGFTAATFFGVPVTGSSIAFLIDSSGSMDGASAVATTGRSSRPVTRLQAAKEQLVLAVQAMPKESQYQVLTFSETARRWTQKPVHADGRSVRSLTELLGRIAADGGTNLHDGLQAALQWQEQRYGETSRSGLDELFVLSDGQPTSGAVRDTATLLEMVREANRYARIKIHCVHTGEPGGDGAELLRQLAEQNGGVFVQR